MLQVLSLWSPRIANDGVMKFSASPRHSSQGQSSCFATDRPSLGVDRVLIYDRRAAFELTAFIDNPRVRIHTGSIAPSQHWRNDRCSNFDCLWEHLAPV